MEVAKLEVHSMGRAKTTKMERIKAVESDDHTQVILASGSKFFLKGMRSIIQCKANNVKIKTLSSSQGLKKHLSKIKPEVLFFDNTTLEADVVKLSNLINNESPNTKIILFSDVSENKTEVSFPNVIFINKRTDSSGLTHLIQSNSSSQSKED